MARPRIQIDRKVFEKKCAEQHTLEYLADFFECSEDTIERWCKREYKKPFAEVFRAKRQRGLSDLRGKMYETAMEGNVTMQIYLSKNWLGMSDKPAEVIDTEDTESYFEEAGI